MTSTTGDSAPPPPAYAFSLLNANTNPALKAHVYRAPARAFADEHLYFKCVLRHCILQDIGSFFAKQFTDMPAAILSTAHLNGTSGADGRGRGTRIDGDDSPNSRRDVAAELRYPGENNTSRGTWFFVLPPFVHTAIRTGTTTAADIETGGLAELRSGLRRWAYVEP